MTARQLESLAAAALPNFRSWYSETYVNDDSISEALMLGCLAQYVRTIYKVEKPGEIREEILTNVATVLEAAAEGGGELTNAVTVGFFETATHIGPDAADFRPRLGSATQRELDKLLNSFDPYDPFNMIP